MGEELLSFKNPHRVLFWKIERAFVWDGRMGREDKQDRRVGRLYVLQRCTWRTGDNMHLKAYAGPNSPKREPLHWVMFWSTFFCSSSSPETIRPRWSLFSTTETVSPLRCQGWVSLKYSMSILEPVTVILVFSALNFSWYCFP